MRGTSETSSPAVVTRAATRWLALAVLFVGHGVQHAYSQTVSSNRSPIATGAVVDMYTADWTGSGDAVETEMVMGNRDLIIRKAVMEFDISDLVPGVIESARIVGALEALENVPAGARYHEFLLSAGNGVIDVSDNNQSGSFSIGWFNHPAGTKSAYNYNITRDLRRYALSGADYLRQVVKPAAATQGWDVVSSSPAPKLELQLRPTTDATVVYYQAPTAFAAAKGDQSHPFSIDPAATRMEIMDWNYAPFQQGRGLLEFDLSSIPAGATIKWAKLDVYVNGLQGSTRPPYGPDLQLAGYFGDGAVTAQDLDALPQWLGMSGELTSTGVVSWNIGPDFVKAALTSGDYLGLRLQPGLSPMYQAGIALPSPSASFAFPEEWPRLAIAYEIPEPSAWGMSALAALSLLGRRKRHAQAIVL